jgi:phenylacetic acid degradation operon negative regulatory protein
LLTFSMPESWRRKRYDLRSRLTWAGFGPLQNGAWLAPAEVDVAPIVAELGLGAHVRAFRIQPIAPTDAAAVIRETFDLATLAERYRSFTAAWSGGAADALVVTLRLSTQWLRIIREDPRVPLHLLPADWPAIEAQQLFRSLHGAQRAASIALASELLETLAL